MRDESYDPQSKSMNTPSRDESVSPSRKCNIHQPNFVNPRTGTLRSVMRKHAVSPKAIASDVKENTSLSDSMKMESLLEQTANLELRACSRNTSMFVDLYCQGRILSAQGFYEQAMKCFREALRLKNITIDTEPFQVQVMFADLLFDIGMIQVSDPSKSLSALHHCLHIRQSLLGPEHPAISVTLYQLASAYSTAGMDTVALDYLLQALLHSCDTENELLFDLWVAIGSVQRALGLVEDSSSSFEEARNVLWRIRKFDAKAVARRMGTLTMCRGNCCLSPEDLNEAVSFFDSLAPMEVNGTHATTASAA